MITGILKCINNGTFYERIQKYTFLITSAVSLCIITVWSLSATNQAWYRAIKYDKLSDINANLKQCFIKGRRSWMVKTLSLEIKDS